MLDRPIAAAVITHAARVLLIRCASPVGALLRSFPSGKVELGESAGGAAAHEAQPASPRRSPRWRG